ncbi:HNH endonuclease signature motif containing protein [Saccharopolyspora gloriosae]|uniref:HNH endonuclease signature motif containing protein n=1 Tax=Saccharopolyspora gloriosae TaxID=455344 RepID=UPI001FB66137|nr:HNH endonuclease signature motif containing protein [Saccharopolyspora gloriosae]
MDPKQARQLARTRKCSCAVCFYCDVKVEGRHEHDHFPVPRVAGGRDVVPACLDCHDLKDRILFNSWPVGACLAAIQGLVESLPVMDNLTAREDLTGWAVSQREFTDAEILRNWTDLPSLSRVLYGKVRLIQEERHHRAGRKYAGPSALASFLRSPAIG